MPKLNQRLFNGGIALALFLFLAGGVLTHAAWLSQLDQSARAFVPTLNNLNTNLMLVIATMGSPLVAVGLSLIIGLILAKGKQFEQAAVVVSLQLGGCAIGFLAKQLVARPRPSTALLADHGFSLCFQAIDVTQTPFYRLASGALRLAGQQHADASLIYQATHQE